MQDQDWINFKKRHPLPYFWKSIDNRILFGLSDQNEGKYCGQAHKMSHLKNKFFGQKNVSNIRWNRQMDKNGQEDCIV